MEIRDLRSFILLNQPVRCYYISMKSYDYLIIGGGIAGVTAAETIRAHDPNGTIAILSEEPHPLYSRVLLPGYLKRRIRREKLFLRHPNDFTEKKIDLLLGVKAIYVDIKFRRVGLPDREFIGFKKLLLASGGRAQAWDVIKEEKPYLYRLQTLEDADRLAADMDLIKNPIVVGASFISLEFLEIFVLNNIKPMLLCRDDYFFKNFVDQSGGEMLKENFEKHGIKTQFNDSVLDIKERGGLGLRVTTRAYREFDSDTLALGIGLERNIDFIRGAGILLGERGIRTNEYLETNIEGIFSAGDAAEFYDVISGKYRLLGNWTNAFLQGKTAGLNMAGKREVFRNVSSYSITNLGFQITVIGECRADSDQEVRIDKYKNQYERFCIQDDVLVGATLINRFQDKPHLTKLIEAKINIANWRESLRDFEFDIRAIPS